MFVGIGVRERTLELATTDESHEIPPSAPNTPEGVATVVAALQAASPRLIAIEATESNALPLLAWIVVSDLPVATVSPAQLAVFLQQHGAISTASRVLAK